MLAGQEISALLKLHILDLWNEVIFDKSLRPLLAYVAQPLLPELTGIVGCNVHFLLGYSGMHKLHCVDLPGSSHD